MCRALRLGIQCGGAEGCVSEPPKLVMAGSQLSKVPHLCQLYQLTTLSDCHNLTRNQGLPVL